MEKLKEVDLMELIRRINNINSIEEEIVIKRYIDNM